MLELRRRGRFIVGRQDMSEDPQKVFKPRLCWACGKPMTDTTTIMDGREYLSAVMVCGVEVHRGACADKAVESAR